MSSLITPAIGDQDFLDLKGISDTFGDSVAEIAPPMADGNAFRLQGKKAPVYQMDSLVDLDDAATCQTTFDDYKALQGTLVTVKDAIGNTRDNQMVLAVSPVSQKKCAVICGGINVNDGDPGFLMACRWHLQSGEAP